MNALRFAAYALLLALSACASVTPDDSSGSGAIEVGFSPSSRAHELVIRAIERARLSIRMAPYSFTNKDVAKALVEADDLIAVISKARPAHLKRLRELSVRIRALSLYQSAQKTGTRRLTDSAARGLPAHDNSAGPRK